jgi:hypothetical protein
VENTVAIHNWPLWWFSQLESAVKRGDYLIAAKAQRELERLGVTVRYRARPAGAESAVRCAD